MPTRSVLHLPSSAFWVRYCKFIPISPSRSKLPEVAHTVLWFKSLCVTFYVFLAAFWHNEEGSYKKEEHLKLFLEIISNIKYSCKKYLIYPDSSVVTFCHIHWFSFSLSHLFSLSTHKFFPKPFDSVGKHILLPQHTSLYSFRALPYVSTVKLSNVENLILIQNYTPHTQILLIVPILSFTPFFFFSKSRTSPWWHISFMLIYF